MKLVLNQQSMIESVADKLQKAQHCMEQTKQQGAEAVCFPEFQQQEGL